MTTLNSAVISQTGAASFTNFTNGGTLTVAAGLVHAGDRFNGFTNQGSGSITVGQNSQVNVADFQSYGTLTLNPGTFNGTSGGVTQITNTGSSDLYFNGGSRTFISTPAQAANGNAGIDLHGYDAIVAGGLFVNNGYVYDSVSAGSHRVVADFGAVVKGAGFYQPVPRTINGGTYSVGNSPGVGTTGHDRAGRPQRPQPGPLQLHLADQRRRAVEHLSRPPPARPARRPTRPSRSAAGACSRRSILHQPRRDQRQLPVGRHAERQAHHPPGHAARARRRQRQRDRGRRLRRVGRQHGRV